MVAKTTENSYFKVDLKAISALDDMNNVNKITKYNVAIVADPRLDLITTYNKTTKFGADDIVETYGGTGDNFTNFKLLKNGFYKITSVLLLHQRYYTKQ